MTSDRSPATEAGRDAEVTLCHFDSCAGLRGPNPCDCGVVATILAIEQQASDARVAALVEALQSEDEIAHGEAYTEERGGLGVCAYCDTEWPCRTQRGIDRALSDLSALAAEDREP